MKGAGRSNRIFAYMSRRRKSVFSVLRLFGFIRLEVSMERLTSRKNPLVMHLKKLGTDRSYRYECGEYLCQGIKLYQEALKWSAPVTAVLFSGEEPEVPVGARCACVPKDILESIAPMESAPDIVFSCRMQERDKSISPGRHIILENLQDPGNVGTIIRTANAFMIDSVILTGSCADPYNPKAVRATMGAIFRQKIIQLDRAELLRRLREAGIPLYATGLDESCVRLNELPREGPIAVAIGNEGQGLSAELFNASDKRITIPMNPACESLNAAAAATVIMWELYR